jgi:hypothetical protein
MAFRVQRLLSSLDLEDRILTTASAIGIVGVFCPWISGEWLSDDPVSHSGFEFFTAYLGTCIALMLLGVLIITIIPAGGGPMLMKRKSREILRLVFSAQSALLTLASLTVLVNVTYEYTRMDIRFGIYITLAGTILGTFYSYWKLREYIRNAPQESFHHPEEPVAIEERREPISAPPPPPPPPPLSPEEHRIRP